MGQMNPSARQKERRRLENGLEMGAGEGEGVTS